MESERVAYVESIYSFLPYTAGQFSSLAVRAPLGKLGLASSGVLVKYQRRRRAEFAWNGPSHSGVRLFGLHRELAALMISVSTLCTAYYGAG